jgi:hypothetical protein
MDSGGAVYGETHYDMFTEARSDIFIGIHLIVIVEAQAFVVANPLSTAAVHAGR